MRKLNRLLKTSLLTLTATAFILAPLSMAQAEYKQDRQYKSKTYNSQHKNNGHKARHSSNRQHKKYSRRNNDKHYSNNNRHRNYNRHNKRHYSYNRHTPRYYYGGHYTHGSNLVFGLVAGSLLTSALTNSNRYNDRYYSDRTVYVQQQPVTYVQPPQQNWTQSQMVVQPAEDCLQIREYQTTITIGGQSVPAYGQSCLQPDGTWKLGAPIPEPVFE